MVRLVVVAVAVLLLASCGGAPTVATTAAPVAPAPVPTTPTAVAWRWTAPTPLHAVVRAGAGVVVAGDDGVTALDGVTGTERWRSARPGRLLTLAQATPDGGSLVLGHDDGSVTALDAVTGVERWTDEVDGEPVPTLTDAVVVLVRTRGAGAEQVARDLRTGDELWTRSTGPGCEQRTVAPQWSAGVVPVAEWCAGRTVLRGLDERTGVERWRLDAGPAGSAGGAGLASATDGSLVVVTGPEPRLLVDPRTGAVRARVPRTAGSPLLGDGEPRVELLNRIVPAVARLDPATGTAVPAPPAPCAQPSLLALAGSTVQACGNDPDGLGDPVVVDGRPPLDLGELAPDDGRPLGRPDRVPEDPVLVPAPGAVVVANRSTRSVVVGLR
ncbi:outer membrane protein assembly factor BamB family protein [Actinomycetospora soli]|uniref:outer membrane protein assembly factor BamB family protein n=1 Tax=Actinomycetospora soli TaxID=2893887 RepID=UPI001E56213B|nr:PQQ-binding-like beta-propeller repeat protein [Actinomycetospora soli]MCD2189637.1 PQQ-like beta-propeller repeat protein [Actinomycetospora soli]